MIMLLQLKIILKSLGKPNKTKQKSTSDIGRTSATPPGPYETLDALTEFSGFGQLIELGPPYHLSWFGHTDRPVRPPTPPVRPMSEV